jgi:hypothetical protein
MITNVIGIIIGVCIIVGLVAAMGKMSSMGVDINENFCDGDCNSCSADKSADTCVNNK